MSHSTTLLLPLFLCVSAPCLRAQEAVAAERPVVKIATGEDVMRLARNSLYNQDAKMKGRLRPGGISFKQVPFYVSVFERKITFAFFEDDKSSNAQDQIVTLSLKDNRYELSESIRGEKARELAPERYGERIRDTEVTFEDISMRFLYWPDPVRLPDEKLSTLETWVVEAVNPIESGPYRKVRVWVDKASSAALKIEGYDGKNRRTKRFQVRGVQRDGDGGWVPELVRVETFNPETGKNTGETEMEFDKPK